MQTIKLLLTATLAILCLFTFAQVDSTLADTIVRDTIMVNVPSLPESMPLITEWFQKFVPVVLTVVINMAGMYSEKIPFFKKIGDTGLRVIAIAVVLGGGYVMFGGEIWEAALSYLMSVISYHTILRPATKANYKK